MIARPEPAGSAPNGHGHGQGHRSLRELGSASTIEGRTRGGHAVVAQHALDGVVVHADLLADGLACSGCQRPMRVHAVVQGVWSIRHVLACLKTLGAGSTARRARGPPQVAA